jgi:hypothetical protein
MSGKATGIGNVAIQIDGRRRALEKNGAKGGGEGGESAAGLPKELSSQLCRGRPFS